MLCAFHQKQFFRCDAVFGSLNRHFHRYITVCRSVHQQYRNRIFFHYLPDTYVLDEKIQKTKNFYQQRRRWLSAQYYSFGEFVHHLLPAIRERKWDFCDKLFQQASFSRVLLLGFTFIFSVCFSIWFPMLACKWWVIFGLLLLALVVAIPRRFWKWRLVRAVCFVPYSFLLMFFNLFRLKEANKRFIHTTHGVE